MDIYIYQKNVYIYIYIYTDEATRWVIGSLGEGEEEPASEPASEPAIQPASRRPKIGRAGAAGGVH